MPFDLLLLPLLGGFVFIRLFKLTQYPTSRLSGQRLIIWAALAGILWIIVSRAIVVLLLRYFPEIGVWWASVSPFPHSGTAFGALLLGCIAWCPANLLVSKKTALNWTTRRYGSQVEILFAGTFENQKQIQITLSDGKIFVGYIMWQPLEPNKDSSYIGVLPTLSGYRVAESKQIVFTTNYVPIYDALQSNDEEITANLDSEDFIKYFPMSDIRLVSVFDPDVYLLFDRGDV